MTFTPYGKPLQCIEGVLCVHTDQPEIPTKVHREPYVTKFPEPIGFSKITVAVCLLCSTLQNFSSSCLTVPAVDLAEKSDVRVFPRAASVILIV